MDDKRKARLLLSVLDRHLHEHYRDLKALTPAQAEDHAALLEAQEDLTQAAHGERAPLVVMPTPEAEAEATPEPVVQEDEAIPETLVSGVSS